MNRTEFQELLANLADCWSRHDYAAAIKHFAEDVTYGDPVRYALYGRDELQRFFEDDDGLPQLTTWHTIVFDEGQQLGAAEYSYVGTNHYHGVVLIRVKEERITHWREYQHIDPREWLEFTTSLPTN